MRVTDSILVMPTSPPSSVPSGSLSAAQSPGLSTPQWTFLTPDQCVQAFFPGREPSPAISPSHGLNHEMDTTNKSDLCTG